MLSEQFNCDIFDIVREEMNEDAMTCLLVVRVKDKKKWGNLVVDFLRAAEDSTEFGISVRKEYYLEEGAETGELVPTFCWSILIWGDHEEAATTLAPLAFKRSGNKAPPPAVTLAVAAPSKHSSVKHTWRVLKDGTRVLEAEVELPHRAPSRNTSTTKDDVKRPGDKGVGVYIENVRD